MAKRGAKTESDYHHGDLRTALVREALEHLRKEGLETLTLRDLARKAGVSHAAPYRHFPDRKSLLEALAEEGFHRLLAALKKEAEAGPAKAFFVRMNQAYVRFALENPAQVMLMFGPETLAQCDEGLDTAANQTLDFVIEVIKKAQALGHLGPGDPLLLAVTGWATVHGLTVLLLNGRLGRRGLEKISPDELTARVTASLMAGLGK